jgi:hypothetical protein
MTNNMANMVKIDGTFVIVPVADSRVLTAFMKVICINNNHMLFLVNSITQCKFSYHDVDFQR